MDMQAPDARARAPGAHRLAAGAWPIAPVLATLLCACTSAEQAQLSSGFKDFGTKVADAVKPAARTIADAAVPVAKSSSEVAKAAAGRMARYMAEKETLKDFKDAGTHAESSLIALLQRSGTSNERGSSQRPGPAANGAPNRAPDGPVQNSPAVVEGEWRWPLDAGIITSRFGARWGRAHRGMDIAAHVGEPVFAMADGEVIYSDNKMSGYGNVVVIKHANNMTTLYAHNSELKAKKGDKVTQGTLIALLGNTGRSTGPHVHFEIRRGTEALDPTTVLQAPKLPYASMETGMRMADASSRVLATVDGCGDEYRRQHAHEHWHDHQDADEVALEGTPVVAALKIPALAP